MKFTKADAFHCLQLLKAAMGCNENKVDFLFSK